MTNVYEYKAKLLQCAKCQKYGHTLSRCNATKHICLKSAMSHPSRECNSENLKCANCEGAHKAGSIECLIRKKQEDVSLQQSKKIGRGRALQLPRQQPDKDNYIRKKEKYLEINVEREPRKKICPFKVEKYLKAKSGIDRSDINANMRGYIVRVESKQQTRELLGMKSLLDTVE